MIANRQRRVFLQSASAGAGAMVLAARSSRAAEPAAVGNTPASASGSGSHPPAPTGTPYEIEHGNYKAVVTEVGATLRSFQVAGVELLDTFGPDEMSRYGMGQVLAPWPGRVDHGKYTFQGAEQQLPINDVGDQNALHGLVRYRDWKLVDRRDDMVTLSLRLFPTEGYPYTLELAITYRLGEHGLSVHTRATNAGAHALPLGLGSHPYFQVGTGALDPATLILPAATYLPTNARLIPVGRAPVAGSALDFRKPKVIGAVKFDTTYTDLARGKDGRARARLTAPGGKRWVEVWMDGNFKYIVAYSGDTLPVPAHRRRGLCMEALTCAPNAFNSGDGLLTLDPGAHHENDWGLDGKA
jgi:aldose 1-epimerase